MERFLRTEALVGKEGLARLQAARVAVVGLGGVGGAALEALVRGGVGAVTLIDGDVFSKTNLNRQLLALEATVGQSKAEAARARMLAINPELKVTVYAVFLERDNVGALLKNVDYVVDCIDDAPAKLAIAEHCRAAEIPMIMCMGTGNRLSSEGLRTANFDKTAGCPLAKKMRTLLKGADFRKLRALYSDAPTLSAHPIEDGGKRTVGSISYLPPIAGYKLAEHTIGRILNQEQNLDIPK